MTAKCDPASPASVKLTPKDQRPGYQNCPLETPGKHRTSLIEGESVPIRPTSKELAMTAAAEQDTCDTGIVYVMSNQETGNSVTVFSRAADGSLTQGRTFPTGGLGAGSVNNPLDSLLSQGSLAISEDRRFLFAVDAGSNEVSVLAIDGETLTLTDRAPSGGTRPVSVTVHQNLVYVLNSTEGTITGFTVNADGKLSPLAGSTQTLIGGTDAGPSQVQFTPDGTQLVVTERGNNVIDVFVVDADGRAGAPVKNDSSGPGPFGFTFAGNDLLIVSELSDAASSYRVVQDGTLTVVSGSVPTTENGACWVVTNSTTDPEYAYVSNAVSGSISGYRIDESGALSLLNPDGHTAVAVDSHAVIDSAASSDGRYLYVLTGGFSETSAVPVTCNPMTISAYRIETGGSLTSIPGPVGLAPGTQGIVAI